MDPDFSKVSDRFLQFVYEVTKLPMIICDDTGIIVKAIVKSRIGSPHTFAQRIVRGEFDHYAVSAEQALANPLTKEGCNAVIAVDGLRLGSFGITGPIQVTQPLALIAGVVIASWIKEERQRRKLRRTSEEVEAGVQEISRRMSEMAERAGALSGRMTLESGSAAGKVARTGGVVKTLHELSQQSRILSLNGSIQAARAGGNGRTFGVIAKEMLEMAARAGVESEGIARTLEDVRGSITKLTDSISESAMLSAAQVSAMKEMHEVVEKLRAAVAGLADSINDEGGRSR